MSSAKICQSRSWRGTLDKHTNGLLETPSKIYQNHQNHTKIILICSYLSSHIPLEYAFFLGLMEWDNKYEQLRPYQNWIQRHFTHGDQREKERPCPPQHRHPPKKGDVNALLANTGTTPVRPHIMNGPVVHAKHTSKCFKLIQMKIGYERQLQDYQAV